MRSGSGSFTSAITWRAMSRASPLAVPSWMRGTSMSCCPTRMAGFSEAMGSW